MFLHKSALDGGAIGPTVHFKHGIGMPHFGLSVHSFNDDIAVGFSFVVFCWPTRFYCCPRWVRTEHRFKCTVDFYSIYHFDKQWKRLLHETNGFGFDRFGRREYLRTELAKLENELKD